MVFNVEIVYKVSLKRISIQKTGSGVYKIFNKIIGQNFPKLRKDILIQVAHRTPKT